MSDSSDVEKLVFAFLQKKGYKQASSVLMQEAKLAREDATLEEVSASLEDTVANYILFHENEEALSPQLFEKGYKSVKRWIENSLDLYKVRR